METKPKELVVISGKGGTGKTSVVASFAALAPNAVLADCDVDAADLHLILTPEIIRREDFSGGSRAKINPELCTACGKCEKLCRFDAISRDGETYQVDPVACEGCGVCAWFCDADAIEFSPAVNGQWFISKTRFGPMVHARLGLAEENSGKLVSVVRTEARKIADERKLDLVIIDGPPGIGCPVISSITGADLTLVITEPTLSGLHDLKRVADLTKHFDIETLVCINKWDLNEKLTRKIESLAHRRGLTFAGKIRYDQVVTRAQIEKKSVVEYAEDGVAEEIRQIFSEVSKALAR